MRLLGGVKTLGTVVAVGPLLAVPITGLVAKPDLVANGRAGWRESAARLVIEIANLGFGRAKPFQVRVTIAGRCGSRVIHYRVLGVEPRGSAFLEADAPSPCPGDGASRIEVDVDPDNQVAEADETNNRGLVMTDGATPLPAP